MDMDTLEYRNGDEYLDMLRRQNKKQTQSFSDFSGYLEAKARQQGIPVRGQFELTPLCNLNCVMCYVHLNAAQQPLLTAEQWKALMRQAYDAGMYAATLTGGECLTYPDFDELYLYLQSLGCMVDVLTNAVLLNEERIRFFRKHPPASIQATLYGATEDAYERVTGRRVCQTVVENIRRVTDAKLPLIISVTPSKTLGEDVFDTIRLAHSLTKNVFVNTSLFTPQESTGRTGVEEDPDAEFYARILRLHKELRGIDVTECPESQLPPSGGGCADCEARGLSCGGGRSGFVINWKGEMLICNRMKPKSFPLRDGFATAWEHIHQAAEDWPRAAACRGCAYESSCGICAAEALKYAQPREKPEALCQRTRYLASRGVLNIPLCD